jgi:hypothetical protein
MRRGNHRLRSHLALDGRVCPWNLVDHAQRRTDDAVVYPSLSEVTVMAELPSHLTQVFAEADKGAIDTWWSGLTEEARAEVARLCDERAETCFFGIVAGQRDHVVPKVRGGRFVPDDDAWGCDEWGPSYFDHLIAHPELVLIWDPTERTFHTGCLRHASARKCWADGAIREDFVCPFARDAACLMRPLRGRQIHRLCINPGQ